MESEDDNTTRKRTEEEAEEQRPFPPMSIMPLVAVKLRQKKKKKKWVLRSRETMDRDVAIGNELHEVRAQNAELAVHVGRSGVALDVV